MSGWKKALPVAVILLSLAFLARRFLPAPGARDAPSPAVWEEPPRVTPAGARGRIGEEAVVCGRVDEVSRPRGVEGRPTFLNFGAPHPRQDFTAVIWGRSLSRFDFDPLQAYPGASLCVAGRVREHRGTPQIEVRGPSQIRVRADGGRPPGADPTAPDRR